MKNYILIALMGLMAACGTVKKLCPDCPEKPCPTCPDQAPCPEPSSCPECPVPPLSPVYDDVSHQASEFEITAILAAPKTLGLFVSDPNGEYGAGVFPMPELRQKLDYEEVLTVIDGNETSFDIGTTEGKEDDFGLVVSALCEREFAPVCDAVITTNGPDFKTLTVTMTQDPNIVFVWNAK